MYTRNTILYTILCCFIAVQGISASHYKIQLGTFVKKIPFTHFAFSGINDIHMDIDKDNVYRYYLRAVYKKYPVAKKVKEELVAKGFKSASIIALQSGEELKEDSPTPSQETTKFSTIIRYRFNQYHLSEKAESELDKLIEASQLYPNIKIAIIGHTDAKGDAAYNVELSKNRVRAVRRYLMANGIAKDQLIMRACGESSPQFANTCEEGFDIPHNRKLNRRVVLFSFDEKGEIIEGKPTEQTVHSVLERVDQKG